MLNNQNIFIGRKNDLDFITQDTMKSVEAS